MLTLKGLLSHIIVHNCSRWTVFLRPPPVARSRFPRRHSWSLPAECVQGPGHHEAIVRIQLGPCGATVTVSWAEKDPEGRAGLSFLFYRQTAVLNQGCDLLTSLIHASPFTSMSSTSCVSWPAGTDSRMDHRPAGHIPAKLNCLFSSRTEKHLTSDCLFFYLTGRLAEPQMDVPVRHGVEEHGRGDQTRAPLLFIEERPPCSGSRRQTLDCSSSLFSLFPPRCRDVEEPWPSWVSRYLDLCSWRSSQSENHFDVAVIVFKFEVCKDTDEPASLLGGSASSSPSSVAGLCSTSWGHSTRWIWNVQ